MKKFLNRFIDDQSGQSLMEIIVGLTIGAVLIGTASIGIAFVLRSTSTNQNLATASQLTQGLLSNVQTFAGSNWQNIYGLSKTSSTKYFLNASGTSYIAVRGQEGMIDNDVTNGLVGEWKLDEAAGTVAYDATGNNDDGVFVGNPTHASSTCKIANCLNFNGLTDTILPANNNGVLNFYASGNYSGVAWIKLDQYQPEGGPSGCCGSRILFNNSTDGGFDWRVWNNGSLNMYRPTTWCSVSSPAYSIPLNQWTHVAFTYSNQTMTIYINGARIDSINSCNFLDSSVSPRINNAGGSHGLFGSIDDVRIYNRALSASEVKQLYNTQPFSRYFYVDNVCRTNDSSGSIASSSSPCSGGSVDDPLTQKATAITSWTAGGASLDQVGLVRYITRWGNFSIRQTDWSGGTGQEGPITAPNSSYSSSTNIIGTSTLGSFQIQNLSQQ